MSGYSGSTICPNCNESCDEYGDRKPFDYTIISCLNCGLLIQPQVSYRDLEELNECRVDSELEPLDKLPKQEQDLWK